MLVHLAVQPVMLVHFLYQEHQAALNAQLARTANQVGQIAVQIVLRVQQTRTLVNHLYIAASNAK